MLADYLEPDTFEMVRTLANGVILGIIVWGLISLIREAPNHWR